jgi:flagellar hook assembly protein FlgD
MLLGNWPNPARPSTRIAFSLPAGVTGGVALSVYDTGGRRVRTFQRTFSPGLNEVSWDGTDDRGALVRSGMYFYRLDVGHLSLTRRLVLVR